MEKQCFKESCQNDQGYSLRERDPCPRGVDSFGIITAVVTFIAKLPPILVYASVNQSFKRQKVINGLRALAGSSRKEV